MVIAIVDPNKKDLKILVKYLRMIYVGCEVVMFSDPIDAANYIQDNPIDILFTEITMPGITGFRLQAETKMVQPAVLTVFVTTTDAYIQKAIQTWAIGYIIKPITRESILESLDKTKFSFTKIKKIEPCPDPLTF